MSPSLDFYNQSPVNGTEFGFTETTDIPFYFNITGTTDYWDCNLTRNGTSVDNGSFNATLIGMFNLTDTIGATNYTEYEYGIVCNQSGTTITDDNKTIFVITDLVTPTITYDYPTDGSTVIPTPDNQDIDVNVTFSDPDGNLYNVTNTIYYPNGSVLFSNSSMFNPTVSSFLWSYTFEGWIPTEGVYNVSSRACDGHTKNHIDEWEDISKTDGAIEFKGCRIYPDALLKDIGDYGFTYEGDRYTWFYDWLKADTTRSYFLECPADAPMVYLPGSSYEGHFVYDDRYWIDFETDEGYDTAVYNIGVNKYRIAYYNVPIDVVRLETKSVGELNCNNDSMSFTVSDPDGFVNITLDDYAVEINDSVTVTWSYTDNDPEYSNITIDLNGTVLWYNDTSFTGGYVFNITNVTGLYYVNITGIDNLTGTWTYSTNFTVSQGMITGTGNFTAGVCPNDDVGMSIIFVSILFAALFFIGLAFVTKIGFMGLLGGILLLVLSWFYAGCSGIIGYVIASIGLSIIIYSVTVLPNSYGGSI